ncbi:Sip1-related alpha-galactosidase [Paenibacillus lignilyticus]|uniref:Raffinose synthase n=1 Tax=Paenibacillus lignilyticus TaxID=1172615 RepID=A0ABS5CCB5_9BACL|nr:Sip1-related alpha-galactosidase [Paenibacillus lignilyticus]MBP3961698.1 hypothetical protein [Paenibacillus lignilyticus]MBP3963631.1 hypothetical protein [Paenibacillus lignilyticus]
MNPQRLFNRYGLTVTYENGDTPVYETAGWVQGDGGVDETGSYETYLLPFRDAEETSRLTLELRCYEHTVSAYMSVQLKQDVFGVTHSLAADAGILLSVGEPVGSLEGILAHYNAYKWWWTRPYMAKSTAALPEKTQALLWKAGGRYTQLFPQCSNVFKTTMRGDGEGLQFVISPLLRGVRTGRELLFVLHEGDNAYEVVEKAAEAVFLARQEPVRLRESKRYPEVFDYLGWCTWDAFYHDVSQKGIEEKAEELRTKQVPVKWVMIDDGWSPVREKALVSFQEDRSKFPDGLAGTVSKLKNDFGVNWVGVWHAFTGYWHGVDPEGEIAIKHRDLLQTDTAGRLVPSTDAKIGFGFWKQWHSWLSAQGIDMLKVDSQSSVIEFVKGQQPLGQAAKGLHEALEASASLYFDGRLINCMGMAQENVWSRVNSAISRNSDDFYPAKPEWFREHALQNAYNSFYHSTLYWGDWDIWWTSHADRTDHAVLRAISGGPVYVSDKVGETDAEVLRPLILSDGRILRADKPGVPTEDVLLVNPVETAVPLKIMSRSGDSGLLACFHIHADAAPIDGEFRLTDIAGMEAADEYAVYSHFGRSASLLGETVAAYGFTVERGKPQLFTAAPYRNGFASFGLIDKYVSAATVKWMLAQPDRATVLLHEGGVYGFASKTAPVSATVNGQAVEVRSEQGFYSIASDSSTTEVLIEIRFA